MQNVRQPEVRQFGLCYGEIISTPTQYSQGPGLRDRWEDNIIKKNLEQCEDLDWLLKGFNDRRLWMFSIAGFLDFVHHPEF
jgi:hypothetical protein